MFKTIATSLFAGLFGLVLLGCDVDKTQEGELPDVDVDVSGDPGQMPEYDVETPDVDVGTETKEVTVPDVDVHTETEEVTVPDVDVTLPDDDE